MILVGLTGGIGSGKSTVSARLAAHGAVVVDADAIVREVQEPGRPVFEAIVEEFGPAVVGPDGALDRQALADRVFSDDDALAALNALVHPAVGAEIARRLEAAAGTDDVVVLDVPLLVESGRSDMAALVVVDVDPDVAVERLVRAPGHAGRRRPGPHGPPGLPRGPPGPGRPGDRQLRRPGRPGGPGRRGLGGPPAPAPRP